MKPVTVMSQQGIADGPGPSIGAIPRVESVQDFLEHVTRREPAVIRIQGHEPLWRQEIEASLWKASLPVRLLPDSLTRPRPYEHFWGYLRASLAAHTVQRMTLADAQRLRCRWMVSGIDVGLPGSALSAMSELDGLTPSGSVVDKTGCWVSSTGCETPIHWDAFGPHNLHMVLTGSKRLVLFHPTEAAHVYCYGGPRYITRFAAAVDVARPDLVRFPKYAEANGLSATLTAGDVLFIPAFWWHHALHVDDFNVSATRWFYEDSSSHPREPAVPRSVHANGVRFLVLEPLVDALVWLVRRMLAHLFPVCDET